MDLIELIRKVTHRIEMAEQSIEYVEVRPLGKTTQEQEEVPFESIEIIDID